jgi:hypothetical protein
MIKTRTVNGQTYAAKRHSTYGGYPWGVYSETSGRFVELERLNADGAFRGYVANFQRKRDAEHAIADILDR